VAVFRERQETTMADQMPKFEIPQEMRKFAEASMEQARRAFDGFINAAHTAVSDMDGRASVARTGAKDVTERAMEFAERNVAASFEFAQKLVRARDVNEVVALQTEYIKSQMEALRDQAQELGEVAAHVAQKAAGSKS
jgi:phasin